MFIFPVQLTKEDWQFYSIDPYSCYMCDHTHTYIMVTTRYSNQQGSKSLQNPCQIQPTENIGNISASRICLWVRATVSTAVSGVLPAFQNLSYRLMCCQSNKVIKSDEDKIYLSESYTKTSYAALYKQWHRQMTKRFIKPLYSISKATSIDSDCFRLPTASVRSNKAANHAPINFDQ